jgi:hypothetical protein
MITLADLIDLPTDFAAAETTLKRWQKSGRLEEAFPRFLSGAREGDDDFEVNRDQALGHASHLAALSGLTGRDRGLCIAFVLAKHSEPDPQANGTEFFSRRPEFANNLALNWRDRDKIDFVSSWYNIRHLGHLLEDDIRNNKRRKGFPLVAACFLALARSRGEIIDIEEPLPKYWSQVTAGGTANTIRQKILLLLVLVAALAVGGAIGASITGAALLITTLAGSSCVLLGMVAGAVARAFWR